MVLRPTQLTRASADPWRARRFALATVVLVILTLLPSALAARVTASFDRPTIHLGESARLQLNFEDGQPSEAPAFPNVANLDFSYAGQSSSFRVENGRSSAVFTLIYLVTPSRVGDYAIPAISIPVGNDRLTTPPLTLKVLKADERLPGSDSQGQFAFLKLVVGKAEAFIGEVLPVEIQLYLVSGQDLQMQPLTGEGFTFGKTTQLPQRQVQIGNTVYYLVAVKTTATATKYGDLTLGPAECRVTLRIPATRRRSNDPFDDFFADPFGPRYELRPAKLTSDPVKLRILPLPETNKPADFTGAVGQFTVSVAASPTNVAVGDPVRLKVRIQGTGALDAINLAQLETGKDFTTYPPTSQVETTDPLGIEGAKTFAFDLVPQSLAAGLLPGVSFSFFDPTAKAYQTLKQPPIPIIVRPSGSAPLLANPNPASSPKSSSASQQDIVHIKTRLGQPAVIGPPLAYRPGYLALQLIPLALLATAFGWRMRREHLARNPHLVRRLTVRQHIRQGLRELQGLARQNDSERFFATTFRLLQEQLGERLNLPAAAITEAVVDDQLALQNAPAELLADLHEIFQACNQQRYAPGTLTTDLASLMPKIESALVRLQQLRIHPTS